jgi:hypothetical protein
MLTTQLPLVSDSNVLLHTPSRRMYTVINRRKLCPHLSFFSPCVYWLLHLFLFPPTGGGKKNRNFYDKGQDVEWIRLAQDRDQWEALENTIRILNYRLACSCENILTICATGSFLRRALRCKGIVLAVYVARRRITWFAGVPGPWTVAPRWETLRRTAS